MTWPWASPEAIIEAIYHFIEGGEKSKAGEVAVENGKNLILGGYLEELNNTLDIDAEEIPRSFRADYLLLQADIEMALNNWDVAEERYNAAIKWAGDDDKKVLASSRMNIPFITPILMSPWTMAPGLDPSYVKPCPLMSASSRMPPRENLW